MHLGLAAGVQSVVYIRHYRLKGHLSVRTCGTPLTLKLTPLTLKLIPLTLKLIHVPLLVISYLKRDAALNGSLQWARLEPERKPPCQIKCYDINLQRCACLSKTINRLMNFVLLLMQQHAVQDAVVTSISNSNWLDCNDVTVGCPYKEIQYKAVLVVITMQLGACRDALIVVVPLSRITLLGGHCLWYPKQLL